MSEPFHCFRQSPQSTIFKRPDANISILEKRCVRKLLQSWLLVLRIFGKYLNFPFSDPPSPQFNVVCEDMLKSDIFHDYWSQKTNIEMGEGERWPFWLHFGNGVWAMKQSCIFLNTLCSRLSEGRFFESQWDQLELAVTREIWQVEFKSGNEIDLQCHGLQLWRHNWVL